MGRRLSLGMRVLLYLQRLGWFRDAGEHSFFRRLLRANDLLKNRRRAKRLLPSVCTTVFRMLSGKDKHTVYLPEPVLLRITPTNLSALIRLWGALPLMEVDAAKSRMVWEVVPGVHFATYTDVGFSLAVVLEVFVQHDYGTAYEGLQVLDVGGYNGDSAVFFAIRGAQAVACIEPYPPAVERIRENLHLAGVENKVSIFPVALGGVDGTGHIIASETNAQENRLREPVSASQPHTPADAIEVPVYTLERLLAELGWDTVNVAKLDCEGCEYAILAQTPEAVLRRVQVWIMEFHKGAAPLVERFKALGYEVEYEEYPDGLGMLRAWLPGAPLPWNKY